MNSIQQADHAGDDYKIDHLVSLIEEPDYRVTQITMSADQRSPWHVHSWIEDLFYVTAGVLRITLQNPTETRELKPGESFAVGAARPHSIEVADKKVVSFLLTQGLGPCDFKVLDELEQSMSVGSRQPRK